MAANPRLRDSDLESDAMDTYATTFAMTLKEPVMPVISRVSDNTVIVEATGRLTIGQGDALLREAIQDAVDRGFKSVILDFSGVRFLDSAGIGEVMAGHRLLEGFGGQLVLAGLSPKVGGVLAATRLSGVLEITASVDSALLTLAA